MRPLLDFDDPGADDHEPRVVTVGDIRAWHDAAVRIQQMFAELLMAAKSVCDECEPDMPPSLGSVAHLDSLVRKHITAWQAKVGWSEIDRDHIENPRDRS